MLLIDDRGFRAILAHFRTAINPDWRADCGVEERRRCARTSAGKLWCFTMDGVLSRLVLRLKPRLSAG